MIAMVQQLDTEETTLETAQSRTRRVHTALEASLGALAAIAIAIVSKVAFFPLMSTDQDEGVYRYQARMLAQGHTTLSAATHAEFLFPWLFGQHDGRLIPKYQPAWPAVIAIAHLLGNEHLALFVAAAGAALATYFLARELEPDAAVYALVLLLLSPIFVIHSGLFLSYLFTSALLTGAVAAALAGLRTRRRSLFLVMGVLLGVAQLTRPVDALIFAVALGVYLVVLLRRDSAALGRSSMWIGIGLLPFVVMTAVYNAHVTGSPTRFPFRVADPLDSFGFGVHRLMPNTPTLQYTASLATQALFNNLVSIPRWLAGGGIGLVLALVGIWFRRRRSETWLLVALVVAFPAVYYFWYGMQLERLGSATGLGPYYYVPIFFPLVVLAGVTLHRIARHSRRVLAAVVLAVLVGSVLSSGTIRHDKEVTTRAARAKRDAVMASKVEDAIVVMRADPRPYALLDYQFLVGDPRLDDSVLYAVDRGARTVDLEDQFPTRRLYQWVQRTEPGDSSRTPRSFLEPLRVRKGRTVTLTFEIENPGDRPVEIVYVKVDDDIIASRVVDASARRGNRQQITIELSAGATPVQSRAANVLRAAIDHDATVAVGVGFGRTRDLNKADLWERRYFVAYDGGHRSSLRVQVPGLHFHLLRGTSPEWAPEDVGSRLVETGSAGS